MIFQRIVSFLEFGLYGLLAREMFRRWRTAKSADGKNGVISRAAFIATSLFALSNLLGIISNFVWPGGVLPVAWTRASTAISLVTAYWWVAFASDFFPTRRIFRSAALCGTAALIAIGLLESPSIAVRGGHIIFAHVSNPVDYLAYVKVLVYWLLAVYAGLGLTFGLSAFKATLGRARTRLAFLSGGFWALAAAIAMIPILLLQAHISPLELAAYTNVLRALGLVSAPLIYWGLTEQGR